MGSSTTATGVSLTTSSGPRRFTKLDTGVVTSAFVSSSHSSTVSCVPDALSKAAMAQARSRPIFETETVTSQRAFTFLARSSRHGLFPAQLAVSPFPAALRRFWVSSRDHAPGRRASSASTVASDFLSSSRPMPERP